jgi:hypothetical protein
MPAASDALTEGPRFSGSLGKAYAWRMGEKQRQTTEQKKAGKNLKEKRAAKNAKKTAKQNAARVLGK